MSAAASANCAISASVSETVGVPSGLGVMASSPISPRFLLDCIIRDAALVRWGYVSPKRPGQDTGWTVALQSRPSTFTGAGKGIERDFESPSVFPPGARKSRLQIEGLQ